MANKLGELRWPEEHPGSPEAKAEEELLGLGLACVPENIQAVLSLQKSSQHPEGFGKIVRSDSLKDIGGAMKEKGITDVIHAEDPRLWGHCKLAIKLVDFLPISEEKKADLKLIMLYHDLGKTAPGMKYRQEVREIQKKELNKGKLYQVAKGHALEMSKEIEAGFRVNGISGRKLEVFMTVVENHMEFSLPEMSGQKLAKLFEGFGKNDDEKREVAELLAYAVQVDSNATLHVKFDEDGEAGLELKDNKTGLNFEKIWQRYLDAK